MFVPFVNFMSKTMLRKQEQNERINKSINTSIYFCSLKACYLPQGLLSPSVDSLIPNWIFSVYQAARTPILTSSSQRLLISLLSHMLL